MKIIETYDTRGVFRPGGNLQFLTYECNYNKGQLIVGVNEMMMPLHYNDCVSFAARDLTRFIYEALRDFGLNPQQVFPVKAICVYNQDDGFVLYPATEKRNLKPFDTRRHTTYTYAVLLTGISQADMSMLALSDLSRDDLIDLIERYIERTTI